jgi:hypothetical protein
MAEEDLDEYGKIIDQIRQECEKNKEEQKEEPKEDGPKKEGDGEGKKEKPKEKPTTLLLKLHKDEMMDKPEDDEDGEDPFEVYEYFHQLALETCLEWLYKTEGPIPSFEYLSESCDPLYELIEHCELAAEIDGFGYFDPSVLQQCCDVPCFDYEAYLYGELANSYCPQKFTENDAREIDLCDRWVEFEEQVSEMWEKHDEYMEDDHKGDDDKHKYGGHDDSDGYGKDHGYGGHDGKEGPYGKDDDGYGTGAGNGYGYHDDGTYDDEGKKSGHGFYGTGKDNEIGPTEGGKSDDGKDEINFGYNFNSDSAKSGDKGPSKPRRL